MYKNIFIKIIYIVLVFCLSFALYNCILKFSHSEFTKPDYENNSMLNQESLEPQKMFLKSWKIIKSKRESNAKMRSTLLFLISEKHRAGEDQ